MQSLQPLAYARPNQCRFCTSRKCHYRIVALDGSFDELACPSHARHLAALADDRCSTPKNHQMSGFRTLRRGVNGH